MTRKLTPDFASSVSLSLVPWKRHQQVAKMLCDREVVGPTSMTLVAFDRVGVQVQERDENGIVLDEGHIRSRGKFGFLGRSTLQEIAAGLTAWDESHTIEIQGE